MGVQWHHEATSQQRHIPLSVFDFRSTLLFPSRIIEFPSGETPVLFLSGCLMIILFHIINITLMWNEWWLIMHINQILKISNLSLTDYPANAPHQEQDMWSGYGSTAVHIGCPVNLKCGWIILRQQISIYIIWILSNLISTWQKH